MNIVQAARLDPFDPRIMSRKEATVLLDWQRTNHIAPGDVKHIVNLAKRLRALGIDDGPPREIFRGMRLHPKMVEQLLKTKTIRVKKKRPLESWASNPEVASVFSLRAASGVGVILSLQPSPSDVSLTVDNEFLRWYLNYTEKHFGREFGLVLDNNEILLIKRKQKQFRLCRGVGPGIEYVVIDRDAMDDFNFGPWLNRELKEAVKHYQDGFHSNVEALYIYCDRTGDLHAADSEEFDADRNYLLKWEDYIYEDDEEYEDRIRDLDDRNLR